VHVHDCVLVHGGRIMYKINDDDDDDDDDDDNNNNNNNNE
jgi:hypothetical protein